MNEKDILAKTYFDTAKVYRKQSAEDANGITNQLYQSVYTGIKCALSQGLSRVNTNQQEAENKVDYPATLFLDPGVGILAGDLIEVTIGTGGAVKKYYAGEPFVYPSHQTVPMLAVERA